MGLRGYKVDDRPRRFVGLALLCATMAPAAAQTQSSPARPPQTPQTLSSSTACRFAPAGEGTVSSIVDGRSFMLADGREIRLAGLEVPMVRPGQPAGPSDSGHASRARLESILAGATVKLSQARPVSDRYGRTLAYVDVISSDLPRPVQSAMVASGFARVGAEVETMACAVELLSQERAARESRLGLWAEPYYVIFEAGNGATLLEHQGQFAIVEGKVASVRTSGSVIYINFGRRWSEALTVTIQKRHERIFSASGIAPGLLESRRVRVRGWIDERGGPRIEATRPEQIEIAELK
jgi:endonuclease YncB( thermonuclease family)